MVVSEFKLLLVFETSWSQEAIKPLPVYRLLILLAMHFVWPVLQVAQIPKLIHVSEVDLINMRSLITSNQFRLIIAWN